MGKKIKNFTDLTAYTKAHDLTLDIYRITKSFPEEERFSLTNQMKRSAVSIPSNIAEGFGRSTAKDKANFYSISKGSTLELQAQLLIAKDLGYVSETKANEVAEDIREVVKLCSGLVKSAMDI